MKKIHYPVCPVCFSRLLPSKAFGAGYWFCDCEEITDRDEWEGWWQKVKQIEAEDRNVQK